MPLINNQNFIKLIAKEMGCPSLSKDVQAILQLLVEIETRKVIQKAGKFMHSDRRDLLNFDDINIALQDLGHSQIILMDQDEQYTQDGSLFIRRDPVFKSAQELLQEEMKALAIQYSGPSSLRGHWIYIDGKIPRTNENKALKNKTEIIGLRQKEVVEKNKKFNIIMDQPESMLTGFELEYYRQVTSFLSNQTENIEKLQGIDVTGNLSNIFPLFLKYFLSTEITNMKMIYFISLLENKYIEKSSEFHLHQIITYLWAYEGHLSLKIGEIIGSYIRKFGQKYPFLYTIWMPTSEQKKMINQECRNTTYYSTMKRIGIELVTGIQIQVPKQLLEKMQEDSVKGVMAARLCEQVLLEYSAKIQCLKKESEHEKYWIPGVEEISDEEYLMMNL